MTPVTISAGPIAPVTQTVDLKPALAAANVNDAGPYWVCAVIYGTGDVLGTGTFVLEIDAKLVNGETVLGIGTASIPLNDTTLMYDTIDPILVLRSGAIDTFQARLTLIGDAGASTVSYRIDVVKI